MVCVKDLVLKIDSTIPGFKSQAFSIDTFVIETLIVFGLIKGPT